MDFKQLLSSPDSQLRIYALMQLEQQLDEVLEDDAKRLLGQALNDLDRNVQEQARRLQSIANQRFFGRKHHQGAYALFDDPALLREPASSFLKGFDVVALRAAAHDILYPVISRLHDIAQGRRPGPLERTVWALGSLRHPGSLPILEQLARGPIPINGVAGALARYNESHAESVVLEIAGNRDCQNRAAALVELGQIRGVDPLPVLEMAIKDPAGFDQLAAMAKQTATA
ncbi:MAG: hypothetical protein HY814_04710 [Candidatus Riflebacteria bacterium]|nr:hypothetical protein [Candidatus Riflebacteria bacterium]